MAQAGVMARQMPWETILGAARRALEAPIAVISEGDHPLAWHGVTAQQASQLAHWVEPGLDIPDTHQDARWATFGPTQGPPGVRSVASVAISGPDAGTGLTLSVMDIHPRTWEAADLDVLRCIAAAPLRSTAGLERHWLDAVPGEAAIVDEEGRISATNARWRRFARENGSRDPTGFVGADYIAVSEAADDEAAKKVADGLRRILAGETDDLRVEYPCPTPTEDRWFLLQASRLGPGQGLLMTHWNITDRVMAEHLRIEAIRQEEAAVRRQGEAKTRQRILNIIAHQVNTPLTPIRLQVAQLRRSIDPKFHRGLDVIDRSVDRLRGMGEVIRRAVDLSSRDHLDRRPVAWHAFWNRAIDEVLRDPDLRSRTQVNVTGSGAVLLDSRWVRIALEELVHNVQHHAPDGPVTIEARIGREPLLRVRDRGPGIAHHRLPSLFSLFAEEDQMQTDAGTGLGLYVVQRIARLHGGSVHYRDGAPGSIFEIRFGRASRTTRSKDAEQAMR